jgi:hypothetical protein
MRTSFEDEGDLRATDVLASLVALWREGASGSLHFSRSGATAGFHLVAGELAAISSSESRFETASILLRAGKLDAATLERLSPPEGVDRALAALQAGVLTKREWRWGEKIRAVEVLSDLLTWIEGDYVFDRQTRPEPGEFRLTVPRLVLELFLRSRDRGLVLHYLGGADVPLARAARFDSEFAAFGLTADAEAVVRLIDGKATVAQIAAEGPADPFAVEKLLAALVTLGLVHPEFAAAEPSPRAAEAEPSEPATDDADEEVASDETPGRTNGRGVTPRRPQLGEPEGDLDEGIRDRAEHAREEPAVEDLPMRGRDADEVLEIGAQGLRGGALATESPLDAAEYDESAYREEPETEAPSGGPIEIGSAPASEPLIGRPLDLTTGIGSVGRPRPRSSRPFLWLLAILAAGIGVVILLRGHGSAPQAASLAAATTPTVTEAVAAAPPTAVASPLQTAATAPSPTQLPERARPTRAAAAPTRAPVRTAAPPRAASAPPAHAVPNTRQAWLDRATRDRQRADADGKARFSIQLELACEISSLVDAWKHDRPAGTMWVLTTPYNGQTCFRVLWGRYSTREAARRALARIPRFFSTPRNRPVVTAIR